MFCYSNSVIQNQDNLIGVNSYRGYDPSPLNNTRNQGNNSTSYRSNTTPESKQYKYFEDALTVCCICGLPPEQAAKEFHEEFKKSPPPNYFKWWRNCWNEYEITPAMVREWLTKCDRLGWSERLGIVAAQTQERGAA